MTRSELSPHSPRVVRKAFRAQAKIVGVTYRDAMIAAKAKAADKKVESPVGIVRRNPGRMDGWQWNGDSFVCARQVDGDLHYSVDAEEQDDEVASELRVPDERVVVSLLDIAQPAKRRGTGKKYVVLPAIRRVKSFNDGAQSEQWEQWPGDEGSEAWETQSERWDTQSEQWEIPGDEYEPEEWEELFDERSEKGARSYSAALRGNQR